MRTWESNPFQNSLAALAQVALHTAGAQGYMFFQKTGAGDVIVLTAGEGVIPQLKSSGEERTLLEYPLFTDGDFTVAVAFAFLTDAEARRACPRVDAIVASIQRIWVAAQKETYAPLVDRVANLEARLMDSKVADRAKGLLNSEPNADLADAIARHVDGVLRPTQTRRILEQALSDLQDEIEERRVVAEAKQIIQANCRVSEEQAHTRLRLLSRKSRKRLKDVAQRVIEDQQSAAS